MPKKWTDKEDRFIVSFFDSVGAHIGPHDLGRSEASTRSRAKKLKDSGAWVAWEMVALSELYASILSGTQSKASAEYIQDQLEQMEAIGWDIPDGWLYEQE